MEIDIKKFYNLDFDEMMSNLLELRNELKLFNLSKDDIRKFVSLFQAGFKPNNLFNFISYKNKEKEQKISERDVYKIKKVAWISAFRSNDEELKIYEDYIRDIYTAEELNEYETFKNKNLWRYRNEFSNCNRKSS